MCQYFPMLWVKKKNIYQFHPHPIGSHPMKVQLVASEPALNVENSYVRMGFKHHDPKTCFLWFML